MVCTTSMDHHLVGVHIRMLSVPMSDVCVPCASWSSGLIREQDCKGAPSCYALSIFPGTEHAFPSIGTQEVVGARHHGSVTFYHNTGMYSHFSTSHPTFWVDGIRASAALPVLLLFHFFPPFIVLSAWFLELVDRQSALPSGSGVGIPFLLPRDSLPVSAENTHATWLVGHSTSVWEYCHCAITSWWQSFCSAIFFSNV